MKYALLIYSGDAGETYNSLPDDEQKAVLGEYFAIAQSPGIYGGAQLQPVDTATTRTNRAPSCRARRSCSRSGRTP